LLAYGLPSGAAIKKPPEGEKGRLLQLVPQGLEFGLNRGLGCEAVVVFVGPETDYLIHYRVDSRTVFTTIGSLCQIVKTIASRLRYGWAAVAVAYLLDEGGDFVVLRLRAELLP